MDKNRSAIVRVDLTDHKAPQFEPVNDRSRRTGNDVDPAGDLRHRKR
jgi:hypothetical protein